MPTRQQIEVPWLTVVSIAVVGAILTTLPLRFLSQIIVHHLCCKQNYLFVSRSHISWANGQTQTGHSASLPVSNNMDPPILLPNNHRRSRHIFAESPECLLRSEAIQAVPRRGCHLGARLLIPLWWMIRLSVLQLSISVRCLLWKRLNGPSQGVKGCLWWKVLTSLDLTSHELADRIVHLHFHWVPHHFSVTYPCVLPLPIPQN